MKFLKENGGVTMKEIEVPERLKGFPFYKGMLVHFTVFVGEDGVPDFIVVNEENRLKCMQGHLCALCGQKLGKEIIFIGGDKSIKSSLFMDGPMHEECALYATKVCPYLKIETWQHTTREARHKGQPGVVMIDIPEMAVGRPRMGWYVTDGYEIVRIDDHLFYHAAEPLYVKWDLMPQPGA